MENTWSSCGRVMLLLGLAGSAVACGGGDERERGDDDDHESEAGTAGSGGFAGTGGSQGGGAGISGSGSGGTAAGAAGNGGSAPGGSGGAAAGSGGAGMTGLDPLPNGAGFEYRGIVNLVSEEGAQALDDFMTHVDGFVGGTGEYTLEVPTRLFYSHYADDYDFVFFITDHDLDTTIDGLHQPVNLPPLLGTGQERPYSSGLGPAHMRAAIGIKVANFDTFPAFAHEIMHNWAQHLSDEFGFGKDRDTDFGGHWGMISANGQLGGFDAASLACETPAGAIPPACTPGSDGRVHYVVDAFLPNSIFARSKLYSPLELYMMGLLPAAEVPGPILRFEDADFDFMNPTLLRRERITIDASGLTEVPLSAIIARHGEVTVLPMDKRHFRSAMVLVTRQPATQPYLDQVADWAAIFAGELTSTNPDWTSFATTTGGRATMTCKVGARKELGPDEALEFLPPYYQMCSPSAQNCGSGLACYGMSDLYCAVAGTAERDEPCEADSDCKAGLVCSFSGLAVRLCAPYCDMNNPTAANSCETLCPDRWAPVTNTDTLEDVAAFCYAGAGGACDPLAQDCPEGQACTGLDAPACDLVGTTARFGDCTGLGSCVEGSTCVGVEGEDTFYCQPYCDPAAEAPAEIACATLCPDGAWEYEGYSVCVPEVMP